MAHAIKQLIARGFWAAAGETPEGGAAKPATVVVKVKQGKDEVELEVAPEDVPIAHTINQHAASNAKPDMGFAVSDADAAILAATRKALADGGDPFGDDELVVGTEEEAAELNAAAEAQAAAAAAAGAEGEGEGEQPETPAAGEGEQQEGEGETPAGEVETEGGATDEAAQAAEASATAAAAPAAAPVVGADEQAILALADAPLRKVLDRKVLDNKRDAAEAKIDDIEARWQRNELTDEERNKEMRTARRELNDVLVSVAKNDSAIEDNETRSLESTERVISGIKRLALAEKSIDYDKDEAAVEEFNSALQVIAKRAKPGETFAQLSLKAHRTVMAMRGVQAAAPKPTPTPKPGAKPAPAKPVPGARRAAPAAPPSLRGLPNAATSDTGGSRGDALGRLKGADYEAAFSRLSAAEKSALLN